MFARWLFRLLLRRDLRRILSGLSPEDRQRFRLTPERDLMRFHRGFGTGLRNGFRHGRFPGLLRHCRAVVESGSEPMSFDALSSVAIREVWLSTRRGC